MNRSGHFLLAVTLGAAALCSAQTPAARQDPANPTTMLSERTLPMPRREEIARLTLAARTPESRKAMVASLEDGSDPAGQLAAARAIASGVDPAGEFLMPLRLMMGTDRTLTEAAAQALASYKENEEALRLLVNFASSRQMRESDRLATIRAIGSTASKPAAEFLLSLLMREDDTQRIRHGAADALIDMTGRIDNGQDAGRWQQWWQVNAPKPEAQWREEMQAYQASRYVQMRLQYEQLTGELQAILTRVYETTAASQQPGLMLTYLRSANADIRRIGALIVHSEAMAARPVPAEAREQIRAMVSDSSRDVRLAVAGALLATNDPAALDNLLAQLEREPDPAVRAAFAAPLASIGDLRAVPALRKILDDPSPGTASAGAAALRELGPVLFEKEPQTARAVARHLRSILDRTASGPGTLALREAVAEAIIPLRDPEMLPTFYQLLRDRATTRIRWAAIRGLGELRDPKAADTIARYLEDRESGVRLEAVRSLGKTSPVEYAEELYRRTNPVEETDASVRDEAWAVLQGTFARIPLDQFPAWLQRYANDPARRSVLLRILFERGDAQRDPRQIASARQLLGNCLIELNQPADASVQYRQALEYFQAQTGTDMVVEQLIEQYLLALLRSRNYAETVVFSSALLKQRSAYQQTVGVLLRNEARLLSDQQRLNDVILLAEASRRIEPVLVARYADELAAMERKARQDLPSTTQPAR